jgi:glutaredoxin 3
VDNPPDQQQHESQDGRGRGEVERAHGGGYIGRYLNGQGDVPRTHMSDELRNSQGGRLDLVLYKFDSCPYCQRVMHRARELGLELPMRDTRLEPGPRQELLRVGGKTQVPCLFINGAPLYESEDIVRYLEREVRAP